jgi:signal transduction histidine kinase
VHQAVRAFQDVNIAAYIALAGVALLAWRRRRDRAAWWAAAAFGALGALEILGFVPNHPGNLVERAVGRLDLALLVVFPFLLFRFTAVFRTARRDLAQALGGLTVLLVLWAFAMPSVPQAHEAWPVWFTAFVVVFFFHWTMLSVVSAVRLFRAGRAQPSVARRRMQMLAFASAAITVALILVAFSSTNGPAELVVEIFASLAVVAFYLGLAPPALFRLWWRAPEQARMQTALESLLTFAETPEDLARRVLEPAAALVGARALAMVDEAGEVVGSWNGDSEATPGDDVERIEIELPGGGLVVWTSPYAPFFGEEELSLLHTLGVLMDLALDRVRLFEAEHEARLQLERANEVKAKFVALAAHELRTPMTTIHGFVKTLHERGDGLDAEQREQVWRTLQQQTERMALLIEQLLDLSRLEADVIEVVPEPVRVRETLEEIVAAAALDRVAVEIDAPEGLVVPADRAALERIVGNLVTNAVRYGAPPVRIHAEQNDRHFRVTVEDAGSGIDPAFVPDLFERFTRSDQARASSLGSGLGLSIARSYARAHGGELLYEPAQPHGARFQLVLPGAAAAVSQTVPPPPAESASLPPEEPQVAPAPA